MVAVINDKDISCLRVDGVYKGTILCVLVKRANFTLKTLGVVLDGNKSYTMRSNLLYGENLVLSKKFSEKKAREEVQKAIEEGYCSVTPPIMWDWGEEQYLFYLNNDTPQEIYMELISARSK